MAAILALAWLVAWPGTGQVVVPGQSRLLFDHDGVDVSSFDVQVDGGQWQFIAPALDGPSTTPGLSVYSTVLPPMSGGSHTIKVRACNAFGCAASDALLVHALGGPPRKPEKPRATTP